MSTCWLRYCADECFRATVHFFDLLLHDEPSKISQVIQGSSACSVLTREIEKQNYFFIFHISGTNLQKTARFGLTLFFSFKTFCLLLDFIKLTLRPFINVLHQFSWQRSSVISFFLNLLKSSHVCFIIVSLSCILLEAFICYAKHFVLLCWKVLYK